MNKEVSNFFIIEFMEELGSKDLFEIFKGCGLAAEVPIHPKRDIKGRRYNFVKFRKVANVMDLEMKLDNIFIRGRKLYANIPRFNREKRSTIRLHMVGKKTRIKTQGKHNLRYRGSKRLDEEVYLLPI